MRRSRLASRYFDTMPAPFTPIAAALPASVPFVGPEKLERQRGAPFAARIGANESALGPSPRARAAIQAALGDLTCSRYGDPENALLKASLAARHGVPVASLVIDAGIDALLGLTVRLLLAPGETAVSSLGAYPTFAYHVNGHGARLETVPYREGFEDPDALAHNARTSKARLVYLANPDNPMGTCVSADRITQLLDALPSDCTLLLDEAYVDYVGTPLNPPIDIDDARLIRYRTFSKAWGLAGLRVGYAIMHPDTAAGFDRIRNHFAVNTLARVAAVASLEDASWLDTVRTETHAGRTRIERLAASNGLPSVPSSTNFVAIDLGGRARAEALLAALADVGIFVRKPQAPPLDRYVRVGIGTEAEMSLLERAFADALASADARIPDASLCAGID